MLALHLLSTGARQHSAGERGLAEPTWAKKLSDEDRRGLTALFRSDLNPYGTFHLDMNKRLDLSAGFRSRAALPAGAADPTEPTKAV
jgi:hypothetical protein